MKKIFIRKHRVPNMILIGSTSRNSGKTTLATSLINKYKVHRPVIALKVTTIHEKNGKCIRGGEGCGVCSSLKGNFEIVEELNPSNSKDTSLLLAAGAERVYWLKALKDNIYEGFEVFISKVPKDTIIICESNSLRKVVNPGVFVMVKNSKDNQIKQTASEVIDQANIIIENRFNNDFEEVVNKIVDIIN